MIHQHGDAHEHDALSIGNSGAEVPEIGNREELGLTGVVGEPEQAEPNPELASSAGARLAKALGLDLELLGQSDSAGEGAA
ncbi:MAG: hypothetical protein WBH82_00920, partial [Arcanobacterium sp.]